MLVYLTDARGVLLGAQEIADTDPIPAGAALDAPPPAEPGQSIVRLGNGWHYVAIGAEPAPPQIIRA